MWVLLWPISLFFLMGLSISTGELVLMGDFNFHVENHENDQHA